MASYAALSGRPTLIDSLHETLRAFPIACFTLVLLTDIAYVQTSNVLWLHFSEWLLLAGVAIGGIAIFLAAIDFLVRRHRPAWLAVLAAIVVLLLALANNFVHTADGWTAVMPMGLTLSALTVVAMLVAGVLNLWGAHRE